MKETQAFLAFSDDIKNRSFLDWLSAHTSFSMPLHRYFGNLSLDREKLAFYGTDKKTGAAFKLLIYRFEFQQLYLGFDNVFSAFETRNMGLGWKPLRITFSREGQDFNMYLIINYSFFRTDNEAWMELLKEWLA